MELYRTIATARIPISILGNPISEQLVAELLAIHKPVYYQVSLEGLQEHNDQIRGRGHFNRVIDFLGILRRHGIHRHVMLTLTRQNVNQVIPLGERLLGLVDRLTFNRLSQVGEGVSLESPTKDEFVSFMKRYIIASRTNPIFGFKDNLFNIFRYYYHRPLFRGCTGYGCGAAFNFVALLPNGEVHACRKFPSYIGCVLDMDFNTIYDSPLAKRFRRGCRSCRSCPIRRQCGGCLAVSHGQGLNIFTERDPHCFMADRQKYLFRSW
jgi:selenobiotic family peptide radical SAM maturase